MVLVTNVNLFNLWIIYCCGREYCVELMEPLQKIVQHRPDLSLILAAVSGWWLKVFKMGLRKYTAFPSAFSPLPDPSSCSSIWNVTHSMLLLNSQGSKSQSLSEFPDQALWPDPVCDTETWQSRWPREGHRPYSQSLQLALSLALGCWDSTKTEMPNQTCKK